MLVRVSHFFWFFLAYLSTKSVNFFIQTISSLKPLIGFWPNFTGMIPGWSLTKFVQTLPLGCLSTSEGQKIGFQNAILKNVLVWNYKAQSFHIWYIASSRGPLPKLNYAPGGYNFTLNYIRKTSNDFFSWTATGNLTKLDRNGPRVVPYLNFSNGCDWLHKTVTGSQNRFLKCNFLKSCLKLQGPEFSYLVYSWTSLRRIIHSDEVKVRSRIESFLF